MHIYINKPLRFARLFCHVVEFYRFVLPVLIQSNVECVDVKSVYDLSREVIPSFSYPEVEGVILDTPYAVCWIR